MTRRGIGEKRLYYLLLFIFLFWSRISFATGVVSETAESLVKRVLGQITREEILTIKTRESWEYLVDRKLSKCLAMETEDRASVIADATFSEAKETLRSLEKLDDLLSTSPEISENIGREVIEGVRRLTAKTLERRTALSASGALLKRIHSRPLDLGPAPIQSSLSSMEDEALPLFLRKNFHEGVFVEELLGSNEQPMVAPFRQVFQDFRVSETLLKTKPREFVSLLSRLDEFSLAEVIELSENEFFYRLVSIKTKGLEIVFSSKAVSKGSEVIIKVQFVTEEELTLAQHFIYRDGILYFQKLEVEGNLIWSHSEMGGF